MWILFFLLPFGELVRSSVEADDTKKQFIEEEVEEKVSTVLSSDQVHCTDRHIIHGCVPELRHFLENKNDTSLQQEAYRCVEDVYHQSDDFYTIKNMTHLLLDLDANEHLFDRSRDNKFISLGYDFAEKLIFHPFCLQDFDDREPLENRCPLLFGKIILLKLKNAGNITRAKDLFRKMKEFEWKGKRRYFKAGTAFPWNHFQQTPQIFMPNLTALPIWPESRRADLPMWDVLENNFPIIKEEIAAFLQRMKDLGSEELMEDTYRFIFSQGRWNQVALFHGRNFTEQCHTFFPKTCNLLKQTLPERDVHHLPWVSNQNEQVMIMKMIPNTDVEIHSGPGNNILNLHLGISGVEGAKLMVANETLEWQEGKVIPFDDSFDHKVNCFNCKEDRVIMLVRYMHPDVTWDHYSGNKKTHFEPIPLHRQRDVA